MLDLLIRGGTVFRGDSPAEQVDVGIADGRIVAVGGIDDEAAEVIDADGQVVCPGFINVLSHAYFTILEDPRSLSELLQGVTTQIFGEGGALGPLSEPMQRNLEHVHAERSLAVTWSRLSEFLAHLERTGTAQNVASFVSHGTLRPYVVGYDDRPATSAELDQMSALVAEEMADGALGVATALIYPPETYGSTEELIALSRAAAPYGGGYISHMRDEGSRLLEAVEELIRIGQEADVPAEIYHLKASGQDNWHLMDQVLDRVEQVRAAGQQVKANVYPYTASSTGLTSIIPDRFHVGGTQALFDRLADPAARAEIAADLRARRRFGDTGSSDRVLVLGFRNPEFAHLQGKTLTQIAEERGTDPVDAALDLIRDDRSRVTVAFLSMSEDNLREQIRRDWVGFGSDGSSMAPEGAVLRKPTHPRSYGTFARVLGHYVREEQVLSLAEAIRRLTVLPATTLGLSDRGRLAPGYAGDVVVFDPQRVADLATFDDPHQLAVGVSEVVVNGQVAVRGGESTGVLAGRALRKG
ncbi:MAG TPA: D-aminoacylase [Beutenbergiaceae bacterium]|nr:D-aminoacylase [Beutenbergiaceae bacterium]